MMCPKHKQTLRILGNENGFATISLYGHSDHPSVIIVYIVFWAPQLSSKCQCNKNHTFIPSLCVLKSLEHGLKSALRSDLEDVSLALLRTPAEFDAYLLRKATKVHIIYPYISLSVPVSFPGLLSCIFRH